MARRQLGFMQLTILVSYSLYYAGYLIVFFGLFMHVPTAWGFAPFHTGQALFFLGSER